MDSTSNSTQKSAPISASASSSMSICYLGPAGTYSHQVANTFRIVGDDDDDDDSTTISTMSRSTITEAYNFRASCCCIPFENSTYGLVSETVSLLTDSNPHGSDSIQIRGEARLPVGHSLLVNKRDYHRLKQQARRRRGDETNQHQDEMKDDDEELNDEELKGIGMVHSHEQVSTKIVGLWLKSTNPKSEFIRAFYLISYQTFPFPFSF